MARIIKIDADYYVEYQAQGLTFRKIAGTTRPEAEALLHHIQSNAGPENYRHDGVPPVLLENMIRAFREETKQNYPGLFVQRVDEALKEFEKFFEKNHARKIYVHDVTPRMLNIFQTEDLKDHAQRPMIVAAVREMFRFGLKKGMLSTDPFLALRQDAGGYQTPRVLSDDEINRLLSAADEHTGMIIRFLIATGLRVEEAAELRWEDVAGGMASIQVKTHAGRERPETTRTVPCDANAIQALRWFKDNGSVATQIFPGFKVEDLKRELDALMDKAGLSGVTFNALRHTFARNALERGVTLFRLSCLMGIQDLAQVMIYEGFARNM